MMYDTQLVHNEIMHNILGRHQEIRINFAYKTENVKQFLSGNIERYTSLIEDIRDERQSSRLGDYIVTSSGTAFRKAENWVPVTCNHGGMMPPGSNYMHFITCDQEGTFLHLRLMTASPDLREQYRNRQVVPGVFHMLKHAAEGLATDPLFFNSHQGVIMWHCFGENRFKSFKASASEVLKYTDEYYCLSMLEIRPNFRNANQSIANEGINIIANEGINGIGIQDHSEDSNNSEDDETDNEDLENMYIEVDEEVSVNIKCSSK